jgi:hypothetical protein
MWRNLSHRRMPRVSAKAIRKRVLKVEVTKVDGKL